MILIKRYSNRKLYCTRTKQYIKLDEIADLVCSGEDIQVIDNESGEDQTALTLAQIILEQEKTKKRGLSHALLSQLIRASADFSSRYQLSPLDFNNIKFVSEDGLMVLLDRIGIPSSQDITRLNQQLDDLAAKLDSFQTVVDE